MVARSLRLFVSAEETNRFGFICGRAQSAKCSDFEAIIDFCRRERIRLLTLRCDVKALPLAHLAEAAGFLLMDTKVHFVMVLPHQGSPPSEGVVRTATDADLTEIGELARAAFSDYVSHYHADPRLPQRAVADAYQEWAERLCRSATASAPVLISQDAIGVTGFAALTEAEEGSFDCELCAVAPRAQGHGVFRTLIASSAVWGYAKGLSRFNYSSQIQNSVVLGSLTRMGFQYDRASYTFHKWFEEW